MCNKVYIPFGDENDVNLLFSDDVVNKFYTCRPTLHLNKALWLSAPSLVTSLSQFKFYPNKTEWASEAISLRFERGRKNGV